MHPLVRRGWLDLPEILADMLGGGGIVGAERDPGGAIAGDRRGILDAIGRLELRVGLEAEDAAAAIFAGASEKVRERRQFLERSEEHTSELQSLMRISYAVFCLKKKNIQKKHNELEQRYTNVEKNTNRSGGTKT